MVGFQWSESRREPAPSDTTKYKIRKRPDQGRARSKTALAPSHGRRKQELDQESGS